MQPNKPVVLVVDDDPVNLDILVQTLEQDYFLIIAKNGKRALDLAFSHHPDLILPDRVVLLLLFGHVVDEALHKEGGLFPRASGMDARALLPDPFFLIP